MSFERDHASCRRCSMRADAVALLVEGEERTFRRFTFDSSTTHYERDLPFLIRHVACDWDLEIEAASLSGHVDLEVERSAPGAEPLVLDAVAFELRAVELDGAALAHVYDGRTLRISLPASFDRGVVRVVYRATPRRGMLFLAPDEHVPGRPRQVWTQCQEEDARWFMPCHDAPHVKMTSEIRVRVPLGWTVLSNGDRVGGRRVGAREEVHYRFDAPHPSYLLSLVAGEFASHEEIGQSAGRDVPLRYLYPRGREVDAVATFGRTARMLEFFSERFGVPYPWRSYAQVVVADFPGGGMENTTATTLYEHALTDEIARLDVTSDELIAHELAHQWFGDLVTCRSWAEGWLNEGFATYCEHLWEAEALGEDEAAYALDRDLRAYLTESARYVRPVVCTRYDAPYDLFDRHLYEKAGVFLHVLRETLGDAAFFAAVRNYLQAHAHGVVETDDLRHACERESGRSLGRMFEQALHVPGHPVLAVEVGHDKGLCVIEVKQLQAPNEAEHGERAVPRVFHVPLSFELHLRDGSTRIEQVTLEQRADRFVFACEERPRAVVVDPRMTVLGEISVKAPPDLLQAQLQDAPNSRARWLAARALGPLGDARTVALLAARLRDEREFWGVRAECADALAVSRSEDAKRALLTALEVAHPKARRAVVRALGAFRSAEMVAALKPIALGDVSILVQAEAARALGRSKRSEAYEPLLTLLGRASWADVVAVAALDGLALLRDERAAQHVREHARYGVPVRVRRAAVRAAPALLPAHDARDLLESLLSEADPNLRIEVAYALAELDDARSRAALAEQLRRDLDPRARRAFREVLRDLGRGKAPDLVLQGDVARLERVVGELQRKVSELSARPEPKRARRTRTRTTHE